MAKSIRPVLISSTIRVGASKATTLIFPTLPRAFTPSADPIAEKSWLQKHQLDREFELLLPEAEQQLYLHHHH